MKSFNKEITVYSLGSPFKGFCVEAHKEKDAIELFLYHKDYGIKEFMFGIHPNEPKRMIELLIAAYVEDYIGVYADAYME